MRKETSSKDANKRNNGLDTDNTEVNEEERHSFTVVCTILLLAFVTAVICIGALVYVFPTTAAPTSFQECSAFAQYVSYAFRDLFIGVCVIIFTIIVIAFDLAYATWLEKKIKQINRKTQNIKERRKSHIQ